MCLHSPVVPLNPSPNNSHLRQRDWAFNFSFFLVHCLSPLTLSQISTSLYTAKRATSNNAGLLYRSSKPSWKNAFFPRCVGPTPTTRNPLNGFSSQCINKTFNHPNDMMTNVQTKTKGIDAGKYAISIARHSVKMAKSNTQMSSKSGAPRRRN